MVSTFLVGMVWWVYAYVQTYQNLDINYGQILYVSYASINLKKRVIEKNKAG